MIFTSLPSNHREGDRGVPVLSKQLSMVRSMWLANADGLKK